MTINSQTGEISGIPEILGTFQFAYLVKEYRSGQFIGSSYREASFKVFPPSQNQIYDASGAVELSDTGIEHISVELFKLDPVSDSILLFQQQEVLKGEKYLFTELPLAAYYLKAETDTLKRDSNYVPTYFPETLFWYNATPLNLCDTTEISRTIHLLQLDSLVGSESLDGYILSPDGNSEPMSDLSLFIMNDSGDVLAHCYTDSIGFFRFYGLDVGTYSIYVDLINSEVLNDFVPGVVLIGDTSITYYLYDDRISSEFVSLGEWSTENMVKAYPNPVSQTLFVEGEGNSKVFILNALGVLVYQAQLKDHRMQIDVSQFQNGMYYLMLNLENGQSQFSKIMVAH